MMALENGFQPGHVLLGLRKVIAEIPRQALGLLAALAIFGRALSS